MAEIAVDDSKESPAKQQIREEQDVNLLSYLKSLKADAPIQVAVIRLTPRIWQGQNIEGTLDTYDEPIDEEQIRELFGGGKYRLKISTLNGKGSWNYAAQRTIKISGNPKLDGMITTGIGGNSSEENPSVVRDAMKMAAETTQRAEARAAAAEKRQQPQGPDPAMQMVMDEMRAAREEAKAKDARLFELLNKKETGAAEMLLGKAIEGESARIEAIQIRIDSELRTRLDMHRAEIDRLHQRYEDIATRQDAAHTREVGFMRQGTENQMATLKVSYDGQIQGYQREIAHLDRELTAAKTELAALRTKKDKPMLESFAEMAAMKNAIDDFSGGKEEGSTIERVISSVMSSPLVDGVASRLAGGPAAVGAEMSAPEADIPFNKPVQLPDGRVIVRKADGGIVQLKRKAAPPTPTGETDVVIPDEDIRMAIEFMEAALSHDADPVEFIRTAKNLAPQITSGAIRQLLETQGVDGFLARVAKLESNSSLLSQHGKNWTRKVAAALLG